jgi:hypothetical protein
MPLISDGKGLVLSLIILTFLLNAKANPSYKRLTQLAFRHMLLFIESAKKIWSLIFEIIDVEWMKLYTQEIDIFFSNPQDEIIYKITKGQRP